MKREERTTYNRLKKTVTADTINVEIPVTWTHEARQSIHELLTVEKGMFARCIYWNDILDEYCVHYTFADYDEAKEIRKEQEVNDIDEITNNLPQSDYTWNGYKKPEPEEVKQEERIFQLSPNDSHKSFYGKAWVKECTNGEKLLQSYNTIVCMIDAQGHFKRLWHGWSATTQRHINAFLAFYGLQNLSGKANWIEMPIAK